MDLKESEPHALLDLCSQLQSGRHCDPIVCQAKINKYLSRVTSCKTAFLFLVSEEGLELSCGVVGDKPLASDVKIPVSKTSNSLGSAVLENQVISFLELNPAHRQAVLNLLGFPIHSFLCVPISCPDKNESGAPVSLLACLAQKAGRPSFTSRDAALVRECFRVVLGPLMAALACSEERRLRKQCQSLLTVARNLFKHLNDVTTLLREIMYEAKNLTTAERCSLFLMDETRQELVAKVFDGPENALSEVRLPISKGIVGYVARTGELLNIKDAYAHPLFYKGMDEATGFHTKNILCFPIKDEAQVIGVAELCNKVNGICFTKFDEEIATAFSIYCAISILNSLMYKNVIDAQHRTKLSNELMMYHMQVSDDEIEPILKANIPSPEGIRSDFHTFRYTPRSIMERDTPMAIIAIFKDLNMLQRWRIPIEALARFVMMTRRGYRDLPYHNWMHAFAVTHFCYLLLKNLRLQERGYLRDLECLCLLVACLCHDLDHRGTTNSFQVASNSVIASLYSSEGSVMERHHFAQAMCILNTEKCNMLDNLSEKDFEESINLIQELILATDVARHLHLMPQFRKMMDTGYQKDSLEHHRLLRCLLMTACDFSDQTKDWISCKNIAEKIYREFFRQGDLEKAMGNRPLDMMDREKACIPSLQIQFIDEFALPVFTILAGMFEEAKEPLEILKQNRHYWEVASRVALSRKSSCRSSLEILEDDSLVNEVLTEVQGHGHGHFPSSPCPGHSRQPN